MEFTHYSKKPFIFNSSKEYSMAKRRNGKPCGIWLSDESHYGWKEWCVESDVFQEKLSCKTVFDVDLENIFVIDGDTRLKHFIGKYGLDCSSLDSFQEIDWYKVREDFSGIYIKNYNKDHCEFLWYMKWDCDSACVWDLSKLEIKTDV